MAALRKPSNGNNSWVLWWNGKQYIRALGTTSEREAKRIKKDAEAPWVKQFA